jgi:RNA polymerase sigma factor (TIGR02999 family)
VDAPDDAGNRTPDELFPLVYSQLRGVARRYMAQERPGATLQATALVHEAYLRIAGDRPEGWVSRAQFFAAAAEAMRRILVEHARSRARQKRGGEWKRLTLDRLDLAQEADPTEVLALDEAFSKLEENDPRVAEVLRLRFFAGLDVEETAAVLGVAPRTVKRDWSFARAWLLDRMGRSS